MRSLKFLSLFFLSSFFSSFLSLSFDLMSMVIKGLLEATQMAPVSSSGLGTVNCLRYSTYSSRFCSTMFLTLFLKNMSILLMIRNMSFFLMSLISLRSSLVMEGLNPFSEVSPP
jgi:hypothetical protein